MPPESISISTPRKVCDHCRRRSRSFADPRTLWCSKGVPSIDQLKGYDVMGISHASNAGMHHWYAKESTYRREGDRSVGMVE